MNRSGILRRSSATAFIVAIGLIVCTSVKAAGIAAPAPVQQEIEQVRLAGQGDFRWFGLEIYQARLWVGRAGYRTEAPDSTKFALELRYARKLDGARIAQSSYEQMQKLGVGSASQREAWLARMSTLFPDVQLGTHISGIHLPGVGARFFLNGKLLGNVPDPDFSSAFFAIWLDPKTSAPNLRDALLKNAESLE